MYLYFFLLILLQIFSVINAQGVVELTQSNFEELTQASKGGSNGDWLVTFYAPWCPHSKEFEPIFFDVAEALTGSGIHVGRVDATAHRELGHRFDIHGFPLIKLIKLGHVYSFPPTSHRSVEEIVDFARSSHVIMIPDKVEPPFGWFGEIAFVFRMAYKTATKDIAQHNYFTAEVFLISLPVIFSVITIAICLIPMPEIPKPGDARPIPRTIPNSSLPPSHGPRPGQRQAPVTSALDTAKKED